MEPSTVNVLQSLAVVAAMNAHERVNRAFLDLVDGEIRVHTDDVPTAELLADPRRAMRILSASTVAWWLDRFRTHEEAPLLVAYNFLSEPRAFWRGRDTSNIAKATAGLSHDAAILEIYATARMLWPLVKGASEYSLRQTWQRLQLDGSIEFDTGRELLEIAGLRISKAELANAVFH